MSDAIQEQELEEQRKREPPPNYNDESVVLKVISRMRKGKDDKAGQGTADVEKGLQFSAWLETSKERSMNQ